jgi:hypothetical protein
MGGCSRFLRFGAGTQSAGIGGRRAFLIIKTMMMKTNANPACQWGNSRKSRCTPQALQRSACGVNGQAGRCSSEAEIVKLEIIELPDDLTALRRGTMARFRTALTPEDLLQLEALPERLKNGLLVLAVRELLKRRTKGRIDAARAHCQQGNGR